MCDQGVVEVTIKLLQATGSISLPAPRIRYAMSSPDMDRSSTRRGATAQVSDASLRHGPRQGGARPTDCLLRS
eukprot:2766189-Rhodomonas_salina.1